ncbi:MAG: DUF3244 domain-containing protein [Bacteroides sp.]|nr:DUF3244 domain-containing protein [Bacteroides sp.]
MKKTFIFLITLFLSISSFGISLTTDVIYSEKILQLFLGTVRPRAINPIVLYINEEGNLRAEFNKDQGEILIRITDTTNTPVYESVMNTSLERETYIPASTLPAGTYTIYFIIDDDNYWYAEFQL